jgi:hypothetical protein
MVSGEHWEGKLETERFEVLLKNIETSQESLMII